jgi:hypothetical protein
LAENAEDEIKGINEALFSIDGLLAKEYEREAEERRARLREQELALVEAERAALRAFGSAFEDAYKVWQNVTGPAISCLRSLVETRSSGGRSTSQHGASADNLRRSAEVVLWLCYQPRERFVPVRGRVRCGRGTTSGYRSAQ